MKSDKGLLAMIRNLQAREILDSRGNPTVEAELTLMNGTRVCASVPSGASTGSREALELRDFETRYRGKGVQRAVANINEVIAPTLVDRNISDAQALDQHLIELDGTANKGKLGANAILAVSLVCAKAAANYNQCPLFEWFHTENEDYILPVPMMNILNGGAHANNNVDVQEFMIMPVGAPTMSDAIRYGAEVFQTLKSLLRTRNYSIAVGDEGGFAPNLSSNEEAIELLLEAIEKAGYKAGDDFVLALDVAATEFFNQDHYYLHSKQSSYTASQWADYLQGWVRQYPIISIEDGMDESDWQGWQLLTEALGDQIQLVGDDLFVTNVELLRKGVDLNIANSILIKPNQIGTLSESLKAIQLAQDHGYNTIMSHRSGETEETAIADLAVAMQVSQIKAGSLSRTDRVAKYNQLLRIEAILGEKAIYAGRQPFAKYLSTSSE